MTLDVLLVTWAPLPRCSVTFGKREAGLGLVAMAVAFLRTKV